jgi:hypothetical protein
MIELPLTILLWMLVIAFVPVVLGTLIWAILVLVSK